MELNDRIGAWLTPAGCFFRVWAPNAVQVKVLVQDGPYWEVTDTILRQELTNVGGILVCDRSRRQAVPDCTVSRSKSPTEDSSSASTQRPGMS